MTHRSARHDRPRAVLGVAPPGRQPTPPGKRRDLLASLQGWLILAAVIGSTGLCAQPTPGGQTKPGAQPAPRVRRDFPFLGVFTDPIDAANPEGGIAITFVYPHSSADEMGLLAGDQIVALNDTLIPNRKVFIEQLRFNNIGGKVRFLIRRKGEKKVIKGKLLGYRGTQQKLQETVRKQMVGKPLPSLPELEWWDTEKKRFVVREKPLAALEGKVGVLFAFDDCRDCTQKRYRQLGNMHFAMTQNRPETPLAFAGIYQSSAQLEKGSDVCIEHATKMFSAGHTPSFPLAIAPFRKGSPPPEDHLKHLWIFNHGIVILDPQGKVAYLQTTGLPEQEFIQALTQQILQNDPKARKQLEERKKAAQDKVGGAPKPGNAGAEKKPDAPADGGRKGPPEPPGSRR